MKYLLDFLFYSKLIAIFAAEFQVLLREGVRFNGSNLVKRAIDVYPVIESGQFLATRMMAICSHCLDYCTLMGMIYLKGVGYCSLFVAGSPEPYDDNGNSPTLLDLLTADFGDLVGKEN